MMRELVVDGATIVDVATRSSYRGWFAVQDGRFVEVEEGDAPSPDELPSSRRQDLGGATVQPGMIDAHMHIESSLVTPRRFAEAALPWGTTTVLQDPHEIANVLGADGIRWMVRAAQDLPLRVYTAISSCVPATSAEIETPNARITPAEVLDLAREPGVIALGELMDFQGLVDGDPHLKAMIEAAQQAGLGIEGHVPTLRGAALSRYLAHGIRSDHTLMTPAKLREGLRKGIWIMVQEKSLSDEVVASVMALSDRSRVMLVTDDVMPNRLLHGHLSGIVQRAVAAGWEPLDAIAAATLRPASYLGLGDLGIIAPGARADYLVTRDLLAYPPDQVVVGGRVVAQDGRIRASGAPLPAGASMRTDFGVRDVAAARFRLPTGSGRERVRARVVMVNDTTSFTTLDEREVEVDAGVPVEDDLALAAVIARAALAERPPERLEVALVGGLGLRRGGWAASFAHDSHNLLVLGRTPGAMQRALAAVLAAGGGMAFAPDDDGEVLLLALPIAGLLSDEPIAHVAAAFDDLERALRAAGARHHNPVLLLTLLPLTVSPDWKLSDKGVVDVVGRRVLAPLVQPPTARA